VLRQITEQERRQMVTDFLEAQQRLREVIERSGEMPKDYRAQPGYVPGAFRERPMRYPGPAEHEVRNLVQGIVALDYRLGLIAQFEAEGG
jgi:hypothetical protein